MRNITFLFLLGCIFNICAASGQKTTAIFLVSRLEGKLCPNKQELLNNRKDYCLEKRPLITSNNFAAISDIYITPDGKKRQLDILLTPKGSKMLNSLTLVSRNFQIALVVNDQLVSIIVVRPPFNSRLINLWDHFDNQDFERIHNELKQSVSLE